jgi:hypothetical protein
MVCARLSLLLLLLLLLLLSLLLSLSLSRSLSIVVRSPFSRAGPRAQWPVGVALLVVSVSISGAVDEVVGVGSKASSSGARLRVRR